MGGRGLPERGGEAAEGEGERRSRPLDRGELDRHGPAPVPQACGQDDRGEPDDRFGEHAPHAGFPRGSPAAAPSPSGGFARASARPAAVSR